MTTLLTNEDKNIIFKDVQLSESEQDKFITGLDELLSEKVKTIQSELEIKNLEILSEALEKQSETLDEKVKQYSDYAINEWIENNKVELDHGLRVEKLNEFVSKMKDVFNECHIDMPTEYVDILGEADTKIENLENKINTLIEMNSTLHSHVDNLHKENVISSYLSKSNLTETQAEKFKGLSENIDYIDDSTTLVQLGLIKDQYFNGNTVKHNANNETPLFESNKSSMDKLAEQLV